MLHTMFFANTASDCTCDIAHDVARVVAYDVVRLAGRGAGVGRGVLSVVRNQGLQKLMGRVAKYHTMHV